MELRANYITPAGLTALKTRYDHLLSKERPEIVEIGPVNESIHKIDERVATVDLAPLAAIYRGVLERLL